MGIKRLWRGASLEHIREDEGFTLSRLTSLITALHKVEGDVEGVDIAVVRVVDENTAMLSLLHLQPHGDRLQMRHPLRKLCRCQSQTEGNGGTGDGVLDTSLVDEGDGKGVLFILPNIGDCRGRRKEGGG